MLIPKTSFQVLLYGILTFYLTVSSGLTGQAPLQEPDRQRLLSGEPLIYKLKPEHKKGRGYKLVYLVDVPLEVSWKFKTDFSNDFLVGNKHIESHRLVRRHGNVIITENVYSNKPGATFRWQTTVLSAEHRLMFELLNPEECGQRYHHGYIQLEEFGQKTKITQVAYFDFFGASWWVNYPWYGGMSYYLKNTTRWEQETVLKLKDRYIETTDE